MSSESGRDMILSLGQGRVLSYQIRRLQDLTRRR